RELLTYTDIGNQDAPLLKLFFAEIFFRTKNNLLHLLILYAPFIMLSAWMIFKKALRSLYGNLVLMVSSVCFVSLLIYQTIYKMSNSWQFYTNNLTLLHVALVFFLIIILFKSSENFKLKSKVRKTILIAVLSLFIARGVNAWYVYDKQKKINDNLFSEDFLKEIQKTNLNKEEKLAGATLIKGSRYYETEAALSANITPYMALMPQYLPYVYMNTFEKFSAEEGQHIINTGNSAAKNYVFYQFMETEKKENTFVNVEQSQSDFIEKYGIRYLIVLDTIGISKKIADKIDKIITDSKSKQKFILLK
ncbi:MAG: hypothetical protein ABI855_15090, partial [Bacteroidota bacterium]